jgi:hypothetical protein
MSKKFLVNADFGNVATATNLVEPTSAQDAATKAYVDSAVEGLAWKDSCRVATQSNINISSPGASVDGVTMAANDRVLVRSQTAGAENGIYVWNGAATAMTRALDSNTSNELEQAIVSVEEGTSAAATYRQTAVNFTLGSGSVAWTTFGTAAGAASETASGIAEVATQGETDAGTDDLRIVTPLKMANWSGRLRKYSTTIGDGSATSFTVTHSLNTILVLPVIFRTASPFDEIVADVEHTTANAITVRFVAAPSSGQFTVVVFG